MEALERFAEPVLANEKAATVDLEEVPIVADGKWEVAVDNSGSTCSFLTEGVSILEGTKQLVASMWSPSMEVIAWNSTAERESLQSLRPMGGTRPETIFSILRKDCNTLVITTDGEIGRRDVEALQPLVQQSSLLNVVAIFVSPMHGESPASLNLPVFAPFMDNVMGRFVLCHWDGTKLRLLLKTCKGHPEVQDTVLPDPPSQIGKDCGWDQFPALEPAELLKITVPHHLVALAGKVVKEQRVLHQGRWWNCLEMKAGLAAVLDDLPDTQADIAPELLQDLIRAAKTADQRALLRDCVQIWYRWAMDGVRVKMSKVDLEMEEMQGRAAALYSSLIEMNQEQEREERKRLQRELAAITSVIFHRQDAYRRDVHNASRSVETFYNAMVRELAGQQLQDFSLEALSGRSCSSNRAARAAKAETPNDAENAWELNGAFVVECDICADRQPQALLAIAIPATQTDFNTSDYALNDAFSIGSSNSQYLPASSVCVFCAGFLLNQGKECPYTRQKIATILPVVKYSDNNFKRLAANVSHWLYQGKKMHLEWQALLAVLDAAGGRGSSVGVGALRFLEQEHIPHVRANFQGLGHKSKLLLEAIADPFFPPPASELGGTEPYLAQLRNKSLESISVLGRLGLRYQKTSAKNVSDMMNRMLFKNIVGSVLGWYKNDQKNNDRLSRILESDLFDTSTGFPRKGTGRILPSLPGSRSLRAVFGTNSLESMVLKPLESWLAYGCEIQISLEMVTLLLWRFLQDVQYQQGMEAFIASLSQDEQPLVWLSFSSPGVLGPDEVLQILAELNKDVADIEDPVHKLTTACFSPATMLGPAVVCCGCCGLAFILPAEIHAFLASDTRTQEHIAAAVKERRGQHFREMFKSRSKSGMVERTSGHSNLHRAVATVIWQSGHPLPQSPTRSMVLHVLAYLRRFPKGGQLYGPLLLQQIGKLLCDYLHKASQPQLALAGNFNLSFHKRLVSEIQFLAKEGLLPDDGTDWLQVFPPVTLECEDQVLVEELTRPIQSVDELLSVSYSALKRRRDVHHADPQVPPATTKNQERKQKRGRELKDHAPSANP